MNWISLNIIKRCRYGDCASPNTQSSRRACSTGWRCTCYAPTVESFSNTCCCNNSQFCILINAATRFDDIFAILYRNCTIRSGSYRNGMSRNKFKVCRNGGISRTHCKSSRVCVYVINRGTGPCNTPIHKSITGLWNSSDGGFTIRFLFQQVSLLMKVYR